MVRSFGELENWDRSLRKPCFVFVVQLAKHFPKTFDPWNRRRSYWERAFQNFVWIQLPGSPNSNCFFPWPAAGAHFRPCASQDRDLDPYAPWHRFLQDQPSLDFEKQLRQSNWKMVRNRAACSSASRNHRSPGRVHETSRFLHVFLFPICNHIREDFLVLRDENFVTKSVTQSVTQPVDSYYFSRRRFEMQSGERCKELMNR